MGCGDGGTAVEGIWWGWDLAGRRMVTSYGYVSDE